MLTMHPCKLIYILVMGGSAMNIGSYVLAKIERCARRRRMVFRLLMVLGACAILVMGVESLQAQGAERGKDDDLSRYNGSWIVTVTQRSGNCAIDRPLGWKGSYMLDIVNRRITAHSGAVSGKGVVAPSGAAHWS